eukprot:2298443-Rhodomonas_salina.3
MSVEGLRGEGEGEGESVRCSVPDHHALVPDTAYQQQGENRTRPSKSSHLRVIGLSACAELLASQRVNRALRTRRPQAVHWQG